VATGAYLLWAVVLNLNLQEQDRWGRREGWEGKRKVEEMSDKLDSMAAFAQR
jgi:hypothetical protein